MTTLHITRRPPWPVRLLALLFGLFGVVLFLGGAYLAYLGGSPYYVLAGAGFIATAVLLWRGNELAVRVYGVVFVATLIWAVWEVGFDGWALLPRLVAPTVALLLIVAALPVLQPRRSGWRAVVAADAAIAVLAVAIGLAMPNPHVVSFAGELPPAGPPDAMADPSLANTGADWPAYGGTYGARRYSPLAEITPDNVGELRRVWDIHTGDMPATDFARGKYGAETTPLKVGNALFLCTPKNVILSLDPATGKERWRYDPHIDESWIPYTAACRGVGYFSVPGAAPAETCANRIVEGTLDSRLIEVDATSGTPCPGFGSNGYVDTKTGMGDVTPGMLSITAAPTIIRGVIVVGHQVLDGQKRDAPSGVIQGFDAVSGALRWAWDMKQPDLTGEPQGDRTYSRGTPNMWTTASGDEKLGYVYIPLGNSAVDYYSTPRSEVENRFASSLVALDVTTGKLVWHFQTVHKDVWDYDLGSQASLVDFPAEGGTVPALVLPSKQGDLYILDRRTGKPLTRVDEEPAPTGGVEPEQRFPTQPHSLYHSLRKADLTEKDMWGMSPIDQMVCRIEFRQATYKGFYTPPVSDGHSIEYPGYNGGSDWGGIAVDPGRGIIVANYNDMPNYLQLVPRDEADRLGWAPRGQERGRLGGPEGAGDPQAGSPFAINVNAGWRLPLTGLLCKQPPYGGITAIDLKTGKTLWDRPLGEARTNGPFGIPSMLPVTIGTPNNGGSVVTGGGIVFIAAATDNLIRAIDLKTGKTLWTDTLPGGGQATPMTYEVDGREYVVIMAGGHHFMETPISDELIAYALP
jgi:quinoprotein glucose dehydrogenase